MFLTNRVKDITLQNILSGNLYIFLYSASTLSYLWISIPSYLSFLFFFSWKTLISIPQHHFTSNSKLLGYVPQSYHIISHCNFSFKMTITNKYMQTIIKIPEPQRWNWILLAPHINLYSEENNNFRNHLWVTDLHD